jgi:hypothetical protein
VVSYLLTSPPISYMHSSSLSFVLHALSLSSSNCDLCQELFCYPGQVDRPSERSSQCSVISISRYKHSDVDYSSDTGRLQIISESWLRRNEVGECRVMIMFYLIHVALIQQVCRYVGRCGLIHGYPSTKIHSVTPQKTVILSFTAVIASDLTVRNNDQSNSIRQK